MRIFEFYDPKRKKYFKEKLFYIGFFELTKKNIETANQKHWFKYFKTGKVNKNAPDYIRKAGHLIEFMNFGEEERRVAAILERAEADFKARDAYVFNDGMEKDKIETAKIMLEDDVDLQIIAKYTRLSLNKIKELVNR